MPTYHFRCTGCQTMTDRKLSFGSTEKPMCETCKKEMVKIIVPPSIQFKGSGFYKTDSQSSSRAEKKDHSPPPTPPPASSSPKIV